MKNLEILKENLKKFFNIVFDNSVHLVPVEIELSFTLKKNLLIHLIFEKDSDEFLAQQNKIKENLEEFFELNDIFKELEIEKFDVIFSRKRAQKEQEKKIKIQDQSKKKNKKQIPGIKKIILVASGKGGVGKSTFAANLALSLSQIGWSVGLLDADIYGASIPLIFGIENKLVQSDQNMQIIPINYQENLKINSIAFITRSDEAIIWRGPMISKALNQILNQTNWGELDFLILDTPPGTGDIHISILETCLIDSVFLISTPGITSLSNTQKTFSMLEKFEIPKKNIYSILNMVSENNFSQQDLSKEILNFQFIQNSKSIFKIPRIENFENSLFCAHRDHKNLIEKISRQIIKDLFELQ